MTNPSRRILWSFLATLAVSMLHAPAARAADPAPRPAAAPAARPNVLFILTDDQRWDAVGYAKAFPIKTPNIDRLAADGVRFNNMFVTTAICAASRASILTGLHERTHRYTFGTNPITAPHVAASYPKVLRDAGYRTGFVGKFGVGVPAGGAKEMFDSFVPLNRTPYVKTLPDGTERHLTDIETDRAVDFIKAAKPGQPWCLSVSFNAPHAEDNDPRQYIWSKASDGLYDDVTFTPPATMADDFFNALPEFLRTSESRVRFKWRFDDPAKYQRMVRGYFKMIADVDRGLGRIREALAAAGLADNTVIVFSADNGYFLGDRGLADKWYIYEESVRVPLVVVDPRAAADRRGVAVDAMALNIDLPATFLDLAGAATPAHYQGRSLRPLLEGKKPADWRTDFFYEHLMEANGKASGTASGSAVSIPKSEGVRTERYTYVRWFEQTPLVEELYDHEADFHCTKNLVADPAMAEVAKKLRERTTELRDKYGGPFRSNAAPKPAKPATRPGAKPAKKNADPAATE
ncbi:MAG TPA: sulfatase [Humisphaera sp.]